MDRIYRGKINQKPISEFVFFLFRFHNSIRSFDSMLEAEDLLNIWVAINANVYKPKNVF